MTKFSADERGFSLAESLIAMGITMVGLLGLAGVFAQGMTMLSSSQPDLVAREKAAEAIESVFSARDTHVIDWADICNQSGGTGATHGVFKDGPQSLRDPGADGLVNTDDDGAIQKLATPGPDNLLGTSDDILMPLDGFTREIWIRAVNPNLRQLKVIVKYPSGGTLKTYTIETLISSYA